MRRDFDQICFLVFVSISREKKKNFYKLFPFENNVLGKFIKSHCNLWVKIDLASCVCVLFVSSIIAYYTVQIGFHKTICFQNWPNLVVFESHDLPTQADARYIYTHTPTYRIYEYSKHMARQKIAEHIIQNNNILSDNV